MLCCRLHYLVDIRQGTNAHRLINPHRAFDHHRGHARDAGHQVPLERRTKTQAAPTIKDAKQTHQNPQINLCIIPRPPHAPKPSRRPKAHERHRTHLRLNDSAQLQHYFRDSDAAAHLLSLPLNYILLDLLQHTRQPFVQDLQHEKQYLFWR